MYNGLRGLRALTDLKSTWILGGVLEKSLNFFNFEWSGAESELIAQSLVFFSVFFSFVTLGFKSS